MTTVYYGATPFLSSCYTRNAFSLERCAYANIDTRFLDHNAYLILMFLFGGPLVGMMYPVLVANLISRSNLCSIYMAFLQAAQDGLNGQLQILGELDGSVDGLSILYADELVSTGAYGDINNYNVGFF